MYYKKINLQFKLHKTHSLWAIKNQVQSNARWSNLILACRFLSKGELSLSTSNHSTEVTAVHYHDSVKPVLKTGSAQQTLHLSN